MISLASLGLHGANLSEVPCDDGHSSWRLAALWVDLAAVEAKHSSSVAGYAARDVAATRHDEDQLQKMYLLGVFSSSTSVAKTGRGKRGGAEAKERGKGNNQWYPILCGMSSVHYHHQRGTIASAIDELRALLLYESRDDEDQGEAGSVEEEERRKMNRSLCLAVSKASPQVLTLYCLHLFRRLDNMDEQQGQVTAFLNTCLGRIRATVLRPPEPSSSSARVSLLCQHLLVALLEAASQSALVLAPGTQEVISSQAKLTMLDDFVVILDSARSPPVRDLLIKRGIIPPLLLLSGDTEGWAKCWSLCLRVARDGDLVSASTLLCLLLHTPLLGTLHGNEDFWWLLQASLLHPEGVVRKRGAFAMDAYGAQNRRAGRSERYWMDDFLDVYTQVENGNAPHLIAQVSAQLDGIFALAASQPEAAETRDDFTDVVLDVQTGHPLPTFAWAKGLVHIMLRAQLPTLRKAALVRVLEGRLRLRPGPGSFRWIFRELLPICDHPLYFSSAYFLGRGKDVGCSAGDKEDEGVEVSVPALAISTKQTPGALFPCFLTRLMRRLAPPDLATCLRELVLTVCSDTGLKSLSAAKWVLRSFSEQSVQADILLPTPCLAPSELLVVRQYLRGKLASTNSVVKDQVLQGLLPLVLCCVDFGTMGLLSLVQVLAEDVGLGELLRDGAHAELFFNAVRRAGRGNVGNLVFSSSVSEGGAAALRTMACILLGEGEEEEEEEEEEEGKWSNKSTGQLSFVAGQMAIAARLYAQPYIKEEELLAAVGFLHGFITLATLQHSQQGQAKQRLLPPLLTQRLHRACPDMATFLVVSIKGALAAPLGQATALRSLAVLEQATECLAGFLLLAEIAQDVSQSSATLLPVVALLDFLAEIVRAAWSTGDASHPLRLALACKSAAILLRSLQRTWPCPRLDRAAVTQCAGSVSSLACALMHQSTGAYEAALPGKYRACLAHLDSHALSPSSSLLLDVREQGCESYSRYSLALMVGKWAALHASLCLWAEAGLSGVPVAPLELGLSEASLLEVIVAQMESCSMRSVPSLLGCALAAIQRLFPLCSGAELEGHVDTTRRLLDVAWQTILGAGVFLDHAAVYAYIRLAFDACTLRHLDSDTTRSTYATVYELGLGRRPHITQALVLQCVAAWTSDRRLCGSFVEEICALLLLKEHKQDDNSVVLTESETALLPVRIVVLSLLERLVATPEENLAPGCLDMGAVVRFLVGKNMHEDFVASAMIGSDLFGEKLRSWQALCVLVPVVFQEGPLLSEVLDAFFASLTYACALPIRTHMEIFGATLAAAFPHVVLPRILNCLADFNLSQQQLASVFVMLGHLCHHNVEAGECPFSLPIAIDVINHIVPWLTCGAGLPRAIALYVVHALAPHVLAEADPLLGVHLRGILKHLQLNRDSIKLLGKQAEFFVQYAISTRCAVRGILALGLDPTGEAIPPHVLDLVVSALKNIPPRDVDGNVSGAEEVVPVPVPSEAAEGAAAPGVVLQCKRVPFDELRLTLQEEAASQQRNAAGRARQSLVVVASLVDKVTNLAGIARTCEIFAVQTLVLPSLAVVKTDEFLGIAVSAADWVPLQEVPPSGLPAYLRTMRRRGYTIACLEQTSSSVSLADPTLTLPQKCVLLLGKEKEGVPVELLQEMDLEIEIPQHGVIRSLNVHVSAALAIYEFSKSSEALLAANGGSN